MYFLDHSYFEFLLHPDTLQQKKCQSEDQDKRLPIFDSGSVRVLSRKHQESLILCTCYVNLCDMQCAHSTLPYFSRQRTSTFPSGISWIRTDGCDLLDANAGCLSVQVVFLPNKYSVVLRCIEYITVISTRMNQQRSVGDTLRAVSFSCCSRQHWTGQLGFTALHCLH